MTTQTISRDPIRVGKIKGRKGRNVIHWQYGDVDYDLDGWASVNDFLPEEFDLCFLKTDKGKELKGWYTGQKWDGLNVRDEHTIILWKRKIDKED